jgi:hypothetical protein
MTTTIAAQLASHFNKFDYRRLPEASKAGVKRLLLDYLGVALAGSQAWYCVESISRAADQ